MADFPGSTRRDRGLYYQPSGQLGVNGIGATLALGGLAALLLGFVYGYLTLYNPLLYFNFLATLGLGFVLGLVTTFACTLFKMRAPALSGLLGGVIGAAGLYVSWVAWAHGLLGRAGEDIWLVDPGSLWELIVVVAQKGAWSLSSWTPTGVVLWVLWAGEALIIVGFAGFVAWSGAGEPFCERCRQWTRGEAVWPLGVAADRDLLVKNLEAGDIGFLGELSWEGETRYTEATIESCPECKQTAFLSLAAVTSEVDKKGKPKTARTAILSNLILSSSALMTARMLSRAEPPGGDVDEELTETAGGDETPG